jgi:hypothetical protein
MQKLVILLCMDKKEKGRAKAAKKRRFKKKSNNKGRQFTK